MRPDAHTLVAAYAAGALEDDERVDVQQHLAQCEVCRDDLRGFLETLAVLAESTAERPPARMREAVLARARMTAQLPPLTDGPDRADGSDVAGSDAPDVAAVSGAGTPGVTRVAVTPGAAGHGSGTAAAAVSAGVGDADGADAAGRADVTPADPAQRRRATTTLFALAATGLTVVALGAGAWGVTSADRLGDVRAQQAAVQRVLSAGDVVTVSGTPELPGGVQGDDVLVLASDAADAALLLPAGLPAAPEGSTWQAWTLSGDEAASAGVFDVGEGEAVPLDGGVSGVDAVAVSLEPTGGSTAPTTDPVLVVPLV